jgi:hypothetical protein
MATAQVANAFKLLKSHCYLTQTAAFVALKRDWKKKRNISNIFSFRPFWWDISELNLGKADLLFLNSPLPPRNFLKESVNSCSFRN